MEQILTRICQESTKIQDIQNKCSFLLDYLNTAADNPEQNIDYIENLEPVLQLFKLCACSEITKLNSLGIDLVRLYTRKLDETCAENLKENIISSILTCCREILTGVTFADDIFAILVEISATFNANLTINHVVEIIELCHQQIKRCVLRNSPTNNNLQSRLSILNFTGASSKASEDDKTISVINLTAGQVCHYFTKHRITGTKKLSHLDGVVDQAVNKQTKISQDFVHLLLYLSKKLETKVCFYRDFKTISSNSEHPQKQSCIEGDETKSRIFLLIKIFNCFYLKCLHYTLLTIPDAWRFMTNYIMEIICKHLNPLLVDILTPQSTVPSVAKKNSDQNANLNNFGRGCERLHFGTSSGFSSSTTNQKDLSLNSLMRQERQYVYKISMELLRLFGLENSMRPVLESLYHRIFLLPPMDQRLDSLIYMQEIFKNPLLVIILISNPICLFDPSTSSSQNLDLFQIFIDAIKEATEFSENNLGQLSLLCLATLFTTLNSLTSFAIGQNTTSTAATNTAYNLTEAKLSVLNSPIVKIVLRNAANHPKMYESNCNSQFIARHSRGQTKYRQQHASVANCYNFLNIKDRICGYDLETFEKKQQAEQLNKLISENNFEKKCQSGEINENDQTSVSDYKPQYLREDFNYQDKLRALVQSSSTGSQDDSRIVEFEKRCTKYTETLKCRMEQDSYRNLARNTIHSKSLHLSYKNLNQIGIDDWSSLAGLKRTNSDNRLDLYFQFETVDFCDLNANSESSVFEISSNTSSQDSSELNDDNCEDNKDGDEDEEDEMDLYQHHLERPRSMFGVLDKDSVSNLGYFERALARIFIRKLRSILPELVNLRNVFVVDEFIQTFASNYCKELFKNLKQFSKAKENEINLIESFKDLSDDEIATLTQYRHLFDSLFINADGIYLATYSALVLNLKLFYLGYYDSLDKNVIPVSEKDFIDDIFNYHITIYLSHHFLAEIYQNILADNFFAFFQDNLNNNQNLENLAFINLLHDIDVINVNIPNAFMLSDYARLERMARGSHKTERTHSTSSVLSSPTTSRPETFRNLNLLIRRMLTTFWDPMLSCLRVGLDTKFTFQQLESINSTYISSVCSILECENKQIFFQLKNWNVCIQISQVLLKSSVQAGYYRRLDTIYELLYLYISKYSCQEKNFMHDFKSMTTLKKSASSQELAYERFHFVLSPIQIESIKTLLSRSGNIGNFCPKIWKHVFNLCKFVTDLENLIFRSCHSSLLSRARISISTILRSNSITFGGSSSGVSDSNNIQTDHYQNVYNFNTLPGISEFENSNLEASFDFLIDKMKSKNVDIDLKSKELEQAVEYLSLFVSQIFENVSLKCNLSLLSNFVTELCAYSNEQLDLLKNGPVQLNAQTVLDSQNNNFEYKSLMLFRLVEVVLRFVRNGRPLLHFMKIWPITASHLVKASAHKDLTISKKSITSMHDIINAVLSSYSEMDFFNFNESIFKSYEKLLFFELCNSDCQQELLLNSICEFVEGASNEIRSGWKSIFKALRGLRLIILEENSTSTVNCIHHVQILVDTFEAFLHTENMHVFTYASVDFVLCIFHLIRNVSVISSSFNVQTSEPENNFEETFIVFLKYLQKFTKILRSIYDVPEDLFVIAPNIRAKKARLIDLDCLNESLSKIDGCDFSFNLSLLDSSNLSTIDKPLTLLQLWCLVFDEYSATIYTSLLKYRPMLLEVFFTLIQCVADMNETLDFAVYCFNHTILPLMQNLLRETRQQQQQQQQQTRKLNKEENIEEFYIFLKSWLEVFNNYIIRFILNRFDQIEQANINNVESDRFESIGLLFKQTLLVYIECLNGEYHDLISILAISSIRYLLLSLHRILSSYFWDILIDCFKIGHQLTLNPLKLLMNSFVNLSSNFASDLERIKIMTTREMDNRSSDFLRKRARQIFFVDPSQVEQIRKFNHSANTDKQQAPLAAKSETLNSDNRIYTIIVETSSGLNNSLSYNLLITQIHNHLALLQILCSILTFNIKPSLSNLMNFLYEDFNEISNDNANKNQNYLKTVPVLNLNVTQYRELCSILKQSFAFSMSFDSRPGLKFLIQHISQTNAAANLYQLSSLVWCAQFAVNFSICCSENHRNEECVPILEDLLSEISTIYVQKVTSMQNYLKTCSTTDQHNSSSSASLSSFILQPLKIFDDENEIEQQFNFSNDQKCLDFKAMNDCKVYQLASSQSISQFMKDYQKVKQRLSNNQNDHSKRPPFSGANCFSETSEMFPMNSNSNESNEPNHRNDTKCETFLQLDTQIFVRIWSDILANCIQLNIDCDQVSFDFMLPQYKRLVKTLVLHASDDCNLRQAISRWIELLADNFAAKNRPSNSNSLF